MSSELFGRYKTVEVRAKNENSINSYKAIIENNTFRIDFEISTKKEADSNSCFFKIYNPPENLKSLLVKGSEVLIDSGYKSKHDNIFQGVIEKIIVEDTDVDIIRKVVCSIDNDLWYREHILVSFDSEYLSNIVDRITEKYGLVWAFKKIIKNVYYAYGKSYSGDLKTLMDQFAEDADCVFYISNGHCFMYPKSYSMKKSLSVNENTGLKSVKENNGFIECEMLLDYEVKEGLTVIADYKGNKYEFSVTEVKFSSNESKHTVWFKGK